MRHKVHLNPNDFTIEYLENITWNNKTICIPYQTKEGKEYSQSIKDFKDDYNELFILFFGFIKNKEIEDAIRYELATTIFHEHTNEYNEYYEDREEFDICKRGFIDEYEQCTYWDDWCDGYRKHMLNMVDNAADFEGKRFWTKCFLDIKPYLYIMDDFVEYLFLDKNIRKNIYTKSRKENIKNKEYTVWLEQENKRLKKIDEEEKQKHIEKTNSKKKRKFKKQLCYILKDENIKYEDGSYAYKIGKSTNPMNREKTLQAEKPTLKLIKQFKKDCEKELHEKYKSQNIRGEWFQLYPTQIKYICTHYK